MYGMLSTNNDIFIIPSLSGVIEEEETGKFNKKKTVNNYRKTVSFEHTRTVAYVY